MQKSSFFAAKLYLTFAHILFFPISIVDRDGEDFFGISRSLLAEVELRLEGRPFVLEVYTGTMLRIIEVEIE